MNNSTYLKGIIITVFLFFFVAKLNSQIMIDEFVFNNTTSNTNSFEPFKTMLTEKLQNKFYIVATNIKKSSKEIEIQKIVEYYHQNYRINFTPTVYILTGKAELSCPRFNDIFNISIEILNVYDNTKLFISCQNLPNSKFNEAIDYISNYISFSISRYIKILDYFPKSNEIQIEYGENKSAQVGDILEIRRASPVITVGTAEVKTVYNDNSRCSLILNKGYTDENIKVTSNYLLETIIDYRKAKEYSDKLKELSEDCQEPPPPPPPPSIPSPPQKPKRVLANITAQAFFFNNRNIKQYFNKDNLQPLVFGSQLKIIPMGNFSVFIKGRVSLVSEILEQDPDNKDNSSKFLFFQGGGGIQANIPIANILYPGVAVSVQYMEIVISEVNNQDVLLNTEHFRGFDAELNGHCSLRIYDSFGIYGEVAYHYYPLLKGRNENWNTTALSFGVGLTFFIDK